MVTLYMDIPLTIEIRESEQEIAVYHIGEPHLRDATDPTRVGLIRSREGNTRGNHVFVAVWDTRYPELNAADLLHLAEYLQRRNAEDHQRVRRRP